MFFWNEITQKKRRGIKKSIKYSLSKAGKTTEKQNGSTKY